MTFSQTVRISTRTIKTRSGLSRETTLPRLPSWWRDTGATDKRLAVIAEFDSSDLVVAMSDLKMHMTASLESPSDVAALLRREMSVRWLAELGRAKVRHLSTSSSTSLWVLHWQQVAADYLAELAWHRLVEVPSEIAQQGVVLAIATNVEREKADSIE